LSISDLTSLLLLASSASESESSSSDGESNVSANVRSASDVNGSFFDRSRCDEGDAGRDEKCGGGEEGTGGGPSM